MEPNIKDKALSALAYVFGIPALYIVLTENRKRGFIGYHGAQAFILWVVFFVIFFMLRFILNLIWSIHYIPQFEILEKFSVIGMGGYALFCAYRSFLGEIFKIPH